MPRTPATGEHRCPRCAQAFTSRGRLGHHWAAEHAPRTSADIPRTSQVMARTRYRISKVLRAASRPKIRSSTARTA